MREIFLIDDTILVDTTIKKITKVNKSDLDIIKDFDVWNFNTTTIKGMKELYAHMNKMGVKTRLIRCLYNKGRRVDTYFLKLEDFDFYLELPIESYLIRKYNGLFDSNIYTDNYYYCQFCMELIKKNGLE